MRKTLAKKKIGYRNGLPETRSLQKRKCAGSKFSADKI